MNREVTFGGYDQSESTCTRWVTRYPETRASDCILLLFIRFRDLEGEQSVRVINEVHIGRPGTVLLVTPDYERRLFGR